jgi:hypothetical protein
MGKRPTDDLVPHRPLSQLLAQITDDFSLETLHAGAKAKLTGEARAG